jgi:propionyl-CoA carboxylase alpha chain
MRRRWCWPSAALSIELVERKRLDNLTGRLRPHRGGLSRHWSVYLDGERYDANDVAGTTHPPVELTTEIGGRTVTIASEWKPGEGLWLGKVDGETVAVRVNRNGHTMKLERRGAQVTAQVLPRSISDLAALMPEKVVADTSNLLLCPMPGLVVSMHVSAGDRVQPGQQLAIVEAMKMENILRAEREATVKEVLVEPGQSLSVDQIMIEFE